MSGLEQHLTQLAIITTTINIVFLYGITIGKVPDAGKDWGQEKRASEDETARWHHRRNGHELGQTSGAGEGQRGLASSSAWGRRVRHDWATEPQYL